MSKIINRVREREARATKAARYQRYIEAERRPLQPQNEAHDTGGGIAVFIVVAVLCIVYALGWVSGRAT